MLQRGLTNKTATWTCTRYAWSVTFVLQDSSTEKQHIALRLVSQTSLPFTGCPVWVLCVSTYIPLRACLWSLICYSTLCAHVIFYWMLLTYQFRAFVWLASNTWVLGGLSSRCEGFVAFVCRPQVNKGRLHEDDTYLAFFSLCKQLRLVLIIAAHNPSMIRGFLIQRNSTFHWSCLNSSSKTQNKLRCRTFSTFNLIRSQCEMVIKEEETERKPPTVIKRGLKASLCVCVSVCESISPVFPSVWNNWSHDSLHQAMFPILKDSHSTVFLSDHRRWPWDSSHRRF